MSILLLSKYKPYNFVNKIDDALVRNIPVIDFNIPNKLLDVYRFKSLYNYVKQNEKPDLKTDEAGRMGIDRAIAFFGSLDVGKIYEVTLYKEFEKQN